MNIFILVLLSISVAINLLLFFMFIKQSKVRSEENLNLNKRISGLEQSMAVFFESIEKQQRILMAVGNETTATQTLISEQKSLIEESHKKQMSNLLEIRERVDYLSTEVEIN